MEPHRINVGKGQENGDVESSHDHLKTVVEQAILLRGSRDFASREEYKLFLAGLIDRRNSVRSKRFAEEQTHLGELPSGRVPFQTTVRNIRVSKSSTIQVKRNAYSVHSRLIGHHVDIVIDADSIIVRHGDTVVQTMPRLIGSGKHAINYRHVIDSLVRKPGAFGNYKYREDMFPTSHFRMAFDALCDQHTESVATREYLKICNWRLRKAKTPCKMHCAWQSQVVHRFRQMQSKKPLLSPATSCGNRHHHRTTGLARVRFVSEAFVSEAFVSEAFASST